MNRADRMYAVLKDGRWHSHREITADGPWFLCNNAASDLRVKRGVDVEYRKINGLPSYRLRGRLSEADGAGTPLQSADVGVDAIDSAGPSVSLSLFDLPRGAYDEAAA